MCFHVRGLSRLLGLAPFPRRSSSGRAAADSGSRNLAPLIPSTWLLPGGVRGADASRDPVPFRGLVRELVAAHPLARLEGPGRQ